MRALIIDCGQAVRSMVAYALGLEGFAVKEAGGMAEVRDALSGGFAPDIVVLCQLSAFGGWTALKWMRAHPALRNVPVLLMADEEALERQMEWKEAGITCWMTRPFTQDIAAPVFLDTDLC